VHPVDRAIGNYVVAAGRLYGSNRACSLIHPIVLAARAGEIPAKRYNRWWFLLDLGLGTALSGLPLIFSRATFLGYETFRVSSSAIRINGNG